MATAASELVIVRRRGAEELSAAKGGAWKIAYADFVTAMMAFFLVMWLINASNEATRAQVASYFNPIKLTDSSTGKRSVKSRKDAVKSTDQPEGEGDTVDAVNESLLLNDPSSVLNRIEEAAEVLREKGSGAGTQGSGPETTVERGEADPFSPHHNGAEARPDPTGSGESNQRQRPSRASSGTTEAQPQTPVPPDTGESQTGRSASASQALQRFGPDLPAKPRPQTAVQHDPGKSAPLPWNDHRHSTSTRGGAARFAKEAQSMRAEIARKLGTGIDQLPVSIRIRTVDEGVLISLTDTQNYGMFETGSAAPDARLLQLVGAVASALTLRNGYVVVRGHTDSRPYRNKRFDNWQLSTARAHMAQYMLVRAGLSEQRIKRVEGLADRDPFNPRDPQAAENRRIEVLLGLESER
jgi:chemotaxis protein MotB